MSDDEKVQTIQEEDEHGNILIYPAWSKKNIPKDKQDKWEVPIYLWNILDWIYNRQSLTLEIQSTYCRHWIGEQVDQDRSQTSTVCPCLD